MARPGWGPRSPTSWSGTAWTYRVPVVGRAGPEARGQRDSSMTIGRANVSQQIVRRWPGSGGLTGRRHVGAPTAVHGAQSSRQAGPVATTPLAPWVVLGWSGPWAWCSPGPHRGRARPPSGAVVVLPPERWLAARLDRLLRSRWPCWWWRGSGSGRLALAGRLTRRPGLGRPGRVGAATALRTSSVQPGPVQLRGPGAPGPPWTQSLRGRALRPRPRSAAVRHGQRVAGHHLPLRARSSWGRARWWPPWPVDPWPCR